MLLYQEDAELLFPARVIPFLRNLRGETFRHLVEKVMQCTSQADLEVLGFVLMMIKLSSCLTCNADSYRAMNGCTICAIKTIRSFKGTDDELVQRWEAACQEVQLWQESYTVVQVQ